MFIFTFEVIGSKVIDFLKVKVEHLFLEYLTTALVQVNAADYFQHYYTFSLLTVQNIKLLKQKNLMKISLETRT